MKDVQTELDNREEIVRNEFHFVSLIDKAFIQVSNKGRSKIHDGENFLESLLVNVEIIYSSIKCI